MPTEVGRGLRNVHSHRHGLCSFVGNYAVRHRDQELIKEVEKNQREIQRLRQRLVDVQLPSTSPDREGEGDFEDISVLRLA